LVEALCYTPKVAGSIPDEVIRFPMDLSFQPLYDPGVYSSSNGNEYQESSCGIKGGWPVRKADNLTAIC
jgi:hypothetical protein